MTSKDPDPERLSSSPGVGPAGRAPLARYLVPALYGVADALVPPGADGRGGGDVDVAPGVALRLRHRGPPAARRVHAVLLWLEWSPWRLLREGRPFSRRPRAARRAALARLRASPLPPLRAGVGLLEALVRETLREAGVAGDAHSSDGA